MTYSGGLNLKSPEEVEKHLRCCIKDIIITLEIYNKKSRSPNKGYIANLIDRYKGEFPDLPIVTRWQWDYFNKSPVSLTVRQVSDDHYQSLDYQQDYWNLYESPDDLYDSILEQQHIQIRGAQDEIGKLMKSREKFNNEKAN